MHKLLYTALLGAMAFGAKAQTTRPSFQQNYYDTMQIPAAGKRMIALKPLRVESQQDEYTKIYQSLLDTNVFVTLTAHDDNGDKIIQPNEIGVEQVTYFNFGDSTMSSVAYKYHPQNSVTTMSREHFQEGREKVSIDMPDTHEKFLGLLRNFIQYPGRVSQNMAKTLRLHK